MATGPGHVHDWMQINFTQHATWVPLTLTKLWAAGCSEPEPLPSHSHSTPSTMAAASSLVRRLRHQPMVAGACASYAFATIVSSSSVLALHILEAKGAKADLTSSGVLSSSKNLLVRQCTAQGQPAPRARMQLSSSLWPQATPLRLCRLSDAG